MSPAAHATDGAAGEREGRLAMPHSEPIRAVLFDAGLTLIRVATPARVLAGDVLADAGIASDPHERVEAMAVADAHIEAKWRQGDWYASERTVRELFVSSYAAGFATIRSVASAPGRDRQLAERMYEAYQEPRHWELFPDVLPALQAMERASVVMGVVSDWGHGLDAILLELELGRYFRFLVVSSRLGVSKPDPFVFQMALGRIAVAPHQALFVGDTYVKDVLGARAAGITPVLLDRDGRSPPVDCAVVRDLRELGGLLGAEAARSGGAAPTAS